MFLWNRPFLFLLLIKGCYKIVIFRLISRWSKTQNAKGEQQIVNKPSFPFFYFPFLSLIYFTDVKWLNDCTSRWHCFCVTFFVSVGKSPFISQNFGKFLNWNFRLCASRRVEKQFLLGTPFCVIIRWIINTESQVYFLWHHCFAAKEQKSFFKKKKFDVWTAANTLQQGIRWKISSTKRECHFSPQQLLQDKSHAGLNTFNKSVFFQCDKQEISFDSNGVLKLNTVYKQEFTLTNASGKELEIEFYTVGFREPHEIVFSPNSCIPTILLIFAQFISRWMRQRKLRFLWSFLAQQSSTRPRQESGVQSETKEALVICSVSRQGQQCLHTFLVTILTSKSVLVVERICISFFFFHLKCFLQLWNSFHGNI